MKREIYNKGILQAFIYIEKDYITTLDYDNSRRRCNSYKTEKEAIKFLNKLGYFKRRMNHV